MVSSFSLLSSAVVRVGMWCLFQPAEQRSCRGGHVIISFSLLGSAVVEVGM